MKGPVGSALLGLLLLLLCVDLNRARPPRAHKASKMGKWKRAGWSPTKVPFGLPIPVSTLGDTTFPLPAPSGSANWLELDLVPPMRLAAKLHDEVVLECVAVGSPPPSITWLKNGKAVGAGFASFDSEELANGLESRAPQRASVFTMAKLRSKLPLRCILPEDEGDYSCVATQDGSSKPLAATSTVVIEEDDQSEDWKPECEFRLPPFAYGGTLSKRGTPAYIHAAESLHMELMGNDILLPCRTGGKPRPKVLWTANDGRQVVLGKKYQINTKGDLVIKNLNWNDMGEFKCTAENAYGSETAATFLYPLAEDS